MTECPVIMRLKSFPTQFGSLLICSFMLSPGQSQHDQTALLYLGLEVSVFEGSKTKCQGGREGGRDVTPPSNTVSSEKVAVVSPNIPGGIYIPLYHGIVVSLTRPGGVCAVCAVSSRLVIVAMVMVVCRGVRWRGTVRSSQLISAQLN